MWVVYDLTQSPLYTGIAGFLFTVPEVLNVFYGPIIDRGNKKRILLIFGALQTLVVLVIPFLEGLDKLSITWILATIPLMSFFTEFTYPVESTLIPRVVGKNELVKANSLMSMAYTGMDLFFNAIAGILISYISIMAIFSLNAGAFLLATIMFFFLKIQRRQNVTVEISEKPSTYWKDFKEGINYVKHPLILKLLFPLMFLNLFFAMKNVNLPVFADTVSGGAAMFGIMVTTMGIGSLIGAILADKIGSLLKFGHLLSLSFLLCGFFWLIMLFTAPYLKGIALIFLLLSEMMIGLINVLYTTLFQQLPPENMIARVNTVNFSLISLAMPIGSLLGGFLANLFTTTVVLSCYGVICIGLSLFYYLNSDLKRLPKVKDLDSKYLLDYKIGQ
jgi:MFS family permease